MCKYCNVVVDEKSGEHYMPNRFSEIWINAFKIKGNIEYYYNTEILEERTIITTSQIFYCPFCGRKLE